MTILLVTPELRTQYMDVRWEVFVREQDVPFMLEVDARDFAPGTLHLAAYDDDTDRFVGAVRLLPTGGRGFRLGRLAVLADYRGRGIGRELVEAVHAIVRNHTPAGESSRILLEAQCQARSFYESMGYTAISETIIIDAGIEHVEMAIELQRP